MTASREGPTIRSTFGPSSVRGPLVAAEAPISIEPGARVGPYEVVRPLGRGAHGQVYEARPAVDATDGRSADDTPAVALKVLHGLPEEARARLAREARAHAELRSPFVVPLLGTGEATLDSDESRVLWLAFELVVGGTLRAAMDDPSDPFDEERIASVGLELGRGLQALHAAGLVHRDLKPANVLVGDDGRCRIADLGMIRELGLLDASLASAELSSAGGFVGTVAYASPEQIEGREAGPQCDFWALGAILFELLAGAPPFARPNPFACAKAICVDRVPLGLVPVRWRPLLQRLLARDPARRLASADELVHELDLLLAAPSTAPRNRSGVQWLLRYGRTWESPGPLGRILVAAGAAALVLLLLWLVSLPASS